MPHPPPSPKNLPTEASARDVLDWYRAERRARWLRVGLALLLFGLLAAYVGYAWGLAAAQAICGP
jgi:hypothetical protein